MAPNRLRSAWSSRRVRRDYSRKSFSNPLFSSGQGGRRWRGILTAVAALTALGGWIWFAAFSPTFRITDIQVNGTQNLAAWEVRDAVNEVLAKNRWLVLPQRSLLVVPESAIAANLNEHFVLDSLDVTKVPPHTLVITLKERVSAVLIQLPSGGQALIGLDGTVVRLYDPQEALDVVPKIGPTKDAASNPKPPAYAVLYDDRDETLSLRQEAVRPEIVRAAIDLPKAFQSVFGSSPVLGQAHLDGAQAQSLKVMTSEGWAIYLNATDNLQDQLGNVQMILKTKIGPNRANLDYIDVRFGDKIFFKMKS